MKLILIFKSEEYDITNKINGKKIANEIFNILFTKYQYNVQSNVSEEVFQSFIDYLFDNKIPDIRKDNILEYDILNREFEYPDFNQFLITKRKNWEDYSLYINDIIDAKIKDKSISETVIATNIDDCLDKNGNSLLQVPVVNLYNIFKHADYKFNKHNEAYELIIKYYNNTKDEKIFILIPLIDGSKLNAKNLEDALQNTKKRYGLHPLFDFQYICQIRKDLDEIKEKQIQNEKNIMQLISDVEFFENSNQKINEKLDKFIKKQEMFNDNIKNTFLESYANLEKKIQKNESVQNQNKIKLEKLINSNVTDIKKELSHILDKINAHQIQIDENKKEQNQKLADFEDSIKVLKNSNEKQFESIHHQQQQESKNFLKQINDINIKITKNENNHNQKHSQLQNSINQANIQIETITLKNNDFTNEVSKFKQQIDDYKNDQSKKNSIFDDSLTNFKKTNEKQFKLICQQQQQESENFLNQIKEINKQITDNDNNHNQNYSQLQNTINKANIQIESITLKNKDLANEINKFKQQIDDNTKGQNKKNSIFDESLANLLNQIKNINEKITTIEDSLDKKYSKLKDSIDSATKHKNSITKFKKTINDEINQIKICIDNNKQKIEQNISEQNLKYSNVEMTLNKLKESNEGYNFSILSHDNIIECQLNEINRLKSDIKSSTEKYLSFEKRIKCMNDEQNNKRKEFEKIQNILFSLICNYKSSDSFYVEMSKTGSGILSNLAKQSKDIFHRKFIVSLSSRDPYNILLPNWNGAYFSKNKGNFSIEFIFKDPINLTGFEIEGSYYSLLKCYNIIIDDENTILEIIDDINMRDKPHISRHDFNKIKCSKFKLVQKGPNWDNNNEKEKFFISLKRIEFFTDKNPKGLVKYWNENFDKIKTNKYAKEKDPHLFPILVKSNNHSPELIFDTSINTGICTDNSNNQYCEIYFIEGAIFMDGYRLKRFSSNKMIGWKIIATTLMNKEVVLSNVIDKDPNSDLLYFSENDQIESKIAINKIKIYRTIENSDSSLFLCIDNFEIFGKYIPISKIANI